MTYLMLSNGLILSLTDNDIWEIYILTRRARRSSQDISVTNNTDTTHQNFIKEHILKNTYKYSKLKQIIQHSHKNATFDSQQGNK